MVHQNLSEFPSHNNSISKPQNLLYIVLIVAVVDSPEYWEMACTGTLLRSNLVLTTASCLMEYDSVPDPVNIKIYERPWGVERRAFKIYIHPRRCFPNVDPSYPCYNFAIIEIDSTTQTVFPNLPRRGQLLKKRSSGCWIGSNGDHATQSLDSFRVINLDKTKWSVVRCRLPGELCKLGIHFSFYMPCRDDVGTPLICNDTLLALYSPRTYPTTVDCLDTYVSYFAQLASSMDWVESIVDAPTVTFNWMNNIAYCLVLFVVVLAAISGIYLCVVEVMQRSSDDRESIDEYKGASNISVVSRSKTDADLSADLSESSVHLDTINVSTNNNRRKWSVFNIV